MKTIEETIIGAVWELLLGAVNFYLSETDEFIQPLERGDERGLGHCGVCPRVELTGAEGTEKERLLLCEVYLVTVTIKAPVRDCYFYTHAIKAALRDDETLGGVAESVLFAKKQYGDQTIFT
jgi:hypothetical protein